MPEGLDVKFFRGRGATREALADEVFLDCGDDYGSLPNKVQEIVRWAYDKGYDYVLKCDDDVVVKPKELLASGFNQHDFVGCQEPACKPGEIKTPYGFCYWMSRKVMKLVIDAPLPGQPGSTHVSNHNNDEAWISTVLHINQIFLTHDARYFLHRGGRPRPAPAARALRAPVRMRPPENNPPPDAFAFCVYLNWNGFHCTPTETILQEYQYLFERYK